MLCGRINLRNRLRPFPFVGYEALGKRLRPFPLMRYEALGLTIFNLAGIEFGRAAGVLTVEFIVAVFATCLAGP